MASQTNEPIAIDEDVLKEISKILAQIQYGSLEISVHNGRIVQLERREKKRFDKSENAR
ncbi:MAG TPA: YezD family protein [Cellvibrio sp.]|nr:YezD family protein [Cellvibrio sp.]